MNKKGFNTRTAIGWGRCLIESFAARFGICLLAGIPILSAAITVPEAQAKHSATSKPAPVISPMARQLKISGKVEVEITISPEGDVENVKPVSGNPLLVEGVTGAVKKWKFSPFMDNGAPSQAVSTLTFEFKQ